MESSELGSSYGKSAKVSKNGFQMSEEQFRQWEKERAVCPRTREGEEYSMGLGGKQGWGT